MDNLIQKLKIYGLKTFFRFAVGELKNKFRRQLMRGSYSQEKEDLVLDKLLEGKKNGFYVDIGACDPKRFNNTYFFYKKGWNGINIEPDVNNYKKFLSERKRDTNLNMGISDERKTLVFYKFIPAGISTFSKKDAEEYKRLGYKFINTVKVKADRLENVLLKCCRNKKIDFFSIDTEGYDLKVLKSNDWKKFRPSLICIESFEHHKSGGEQKEYDYIEPFLSKVEYVKVFENGLNSVYKSKNK